MCEHCSEIVLFSFWRLTVSRCTWACCRIGVSWLKRNGVTVELFRV